MGQKGHIMVQKGLKMHKKRQKIEFLDLKRRFFSLAELGGTPTPPLTENHRGKKKVFFLSGKGGYPHPPLNGRIPLKRFWQVPLGALYALSWYMQLLNSHEQVRQTLMKSRLSPPGQRPIVCIDEAQVRVFLLSSSIIWSFNLGLRPGSWMGRLQD